MRLPDALWIDLAGHAQGRDCWALVAEVYRRRGTDLVGFAPDRYDDWHGTDTPEAGDVVYFLRDGRTHVGIVLDDREYLHATDAGLVVVGRIDALRRAGRTLRFLRHAGTKAVSVCPTPVAGTVRVVYIPDPVGRPAERRTWFREAGTIGTLAPPGANVVMTAQGPRTLADVSDRDAGAVVVYASLPGATSVVLAAIGLFLSVASAVIGILTAPKPPESRSDESSPTFDLDGIRNTAASGIVQPVVYGSHRTAGNFISATQRVDAEGRAVFSGLIFLSRGPVQSIGGLTADADELSGSAIPDSILIDDNPARNYDARVSVRLGSSEQAVIPGFNELATTTTVNAVIDQPSPPANWGNAQPYGYQTSQPVTGFDVLLTYPGGLIGYSTSNNNAYSITMTYAVRYRVTGTTTWTTETWVHSGQRNAQINYQFAKRGLSRDSYEIQVQFLSAVTPGGNAQGGPDTLYAAQVLAVNEIVAEGFAYPGCALLGVRLVGSDQLAGGIPTITAQVEGRLVYVWDGVSSVTPAFTVAYSRNPAWCILDILISQDYGLGRGGRLKLDGVVLDEWLDFADWCDELVDDGRGGTVARAYCDHVADAERSGWDLARELAASAFGRLYFAGGKVRLWIDREASPVFLFSAGNSREVKVSYTGRRTRPNAAEVQYLNAEADYDPDYATKLDDAAVISSAEAIRKESVAGTGITRAAQAYRYAQRLVNVTGSVRRRFEWVGGPDSVHLQPGDVAYIQAAALGIGQGGRVLSATSSTVKLDRTITAASRVRLVVTSQLDVTETVYIAAGSYARNATINIVDAAGAGTTWGATPTAGSKWAIGSLSSQSVTPVTVRIESVAVNAELDVRFEGSEYVAAVYDDDPGDVEEFTDDLPDPREMPASVSGLRVTDAALVSSDGSVSDALSVAFDPINAWDAAEVWYRTAGGIGWTFFGWSRGSALIPVAAGTYEVAVPARSASGTRQTLDAAAKAGCHVRGRRTAPDAPASVLAAVTAAGILTVTVTAPDDATVAGYEIRHGLRLVATTAGTEWSGPCPFVGTGTISVRSVSRYGVPSATAVTAAVTWTLAPSVFTLDLDADEDPSWPGDLNDLTLTGAELEITGSALTGVYTTDDAAPTNTTDPQQVVITAVTDLADVAMTWDEAGFTWAGTSLTWDTAYLSGAEVTLLDSPTWDQAGWTWEGLQGSLRTWDGPSDVVAALEPDLSYDDNADLSFTAYPGPFVLPSVSSIAARVTLNRPHARYEPRLVSLNLTTLDLSDAGGGGGSAEVDDTISAVVFWG